MNWRISFYSAALQEEILGLPAGFVARFLRYAERMEIYGPDLGMPHTRAMGQGLFGLRLKAAEGIARWWAVGWSCFTSSSRNLRRHRPKNY